MRKKMNTDRTVAWSVPCQSTLLAPYSKVRSRSMMLPSWRRMVIVWVWSPSLYELLVFSEPYPERQAWSVRLICRHSGYISNSRWPSISMTFARHRGMRRPQRLNDATDPDDPTRLPWQCRTAKVIPRHQGTPGIFGHHLTRRAIHGHSLHLWKMPHRFFLCLKRALVAPHWNILRCDVQFLSMRNL